MSLRDLATTACDGASSSSNPLAAVSDAVQPRTAQPYHHQRHGQASHAHASQRYELTPEEAALLYAEVPHAALEASSQRLPPRYMPPPPPPLADAFVKRPSWLLRPPTLPTPAPGDATAVFERAFRSAGKHVARLPPPAPYQPLSHVRPSLPSRYAYPPPHPHLLHAMRGLGVTSHHPPTQAPTQAATQVPTQAPPRTDPQSLNHDPVSAVHQSSAREASKRDARITADSRSWGDEFTSFENADVTTVELEGADVYDRFLFDDTVEGAFQQWLRRDDMQQYRYAERERDVSKTAQQALEEGIRHREEGRLTKAIECFEDALNRTAADSLQRDQCASAWYLLGITLAETDDDRRAIQALRQGISEWSGEAVGERRADNPHVWQSLVALAVSYTNELEIGKALLHMREWFELWQSRHSADSEAGIPASVGVTEIQGADVLAERLNAATANNPNDVDVFIVLGILHTVNKDYSSAADAFRHAVMLRPEDPSLWNKLGATLANGGNSDDALRAYRKAVDLNPSLIRAWVNVGTAYANRNEFLKATRYYLKAIAMSNQQAEKEQDGDRMAHVWGYLRTSLISLSRPDILHLVDQKNLNALRTHFNF